VDTRRENFTAFSFQTSRLRWTTKEKPQQDWGFSNTA